MLNIFKRGHQTLTTDMATWVVRWNRRYGQFSADYKETAQFFSDEGEAKEFADSLRRATQLLGHTSSELTWVVCAKVENKGL